MSPVDSDVLGKQLGLARHFLDIGRPDRALHALDALPGGGLDEPGVWVLRSAALHDAGDYDRAADVARRGLALDPASAVLLDLLALAEEQLGDLATAERALLSALELEPENPALLCRYAHLLVRGLDLAKAARVLELAERAAPDDPEVARVRMALAYVRGDETSVLKASEALLRQEPEDSTAHRSLAVFRTGQGEVKRAERHFAEAARSDPTDHEAAAVAREARINAHWLFWPLRPFWRFGLFKTYVVHWGVIVALVTLAEWAEKVAGEGVAAVFYVLVFCVVFGWLLLAVYSWIGPPLIRPWLRRRLR